MKFLTSITTSKSFFNPTIGEICQIRIELASVGELSALILDRDGYVVATIAKHLKVSAGKQVFDWDGKNDQGVIVPDEAYSLKIDFQVNDVKETYFPANGDLEEIKPELNYYDRRNGIFSYKLPKPARVHVQAGSAKIKPKKGESSGPVMKTLVNREPRTAGAVIEHWNGYDEGNTIYVPDLPNFVNAIAATALPENSIITVGNRTQTFAESISGRKGQTQFSHTFEAHHHHKGLTTLEDISPPMVLKPVNANWDQNARAWKPQKDELQIQGNILGPSASYFTIQPGRLWFYVDGNVIKAIEQPKAPFHLNIPISKLPPGIHIVSVNWASVYGPTSANSLRILMGQENVSKTNAK